MIRTIIIDDEYNAREFLEKLLIRYFPNRFVILDKCESVDQAVISIEKHNPELVFLDVQMPNKNGFELFKELKKIDFEVIFTTAHAEFAIDAIKCSALDYLLKPINYIDLVSTIKSYDSKQTKESQLTKLQILIENIDLGNSEFNKIALPTDTGLELLKPNNILYCEANSNYCKIKLLSGKVIIVSKTLKYIEDLLPNSIFNRIHKSYLINLNYVVRFNKTNDLIVEISNGEKLPVSVRKKEEFLNAITNKK